MPDAMKDYGTAVARMSVARVDWNKYRTRVQQSADWLALCVDPTILDQRSESFERSVTNDLPFAEEAQATIWEFIDARAALRKALGALSSDQRRGLLTPLTVLSIQVDDPSVAIGNGNN
jgi:hypothetical protein